MEQEIRLLSGEQEIRLVNGRLLDEVIQNHAQMEDESNGFRCVLDRETLNEKLLPELHLQGAIIRGTSFVDADLSGGDWSRVTIEDGNFQRAILTSIDLGGAEAKATSRSAGLRARSSRTQSCVTVTSGARARAMAVFRA